MEDPSGERQVLAMAIHENVAAVYVSATNRPGERVMCLCIREGDEWFGGCEGSGALWACGPEGYPYQGIGAVAVDSVDMPQGADAVRILYASGTTRDVLVEEGVALLLDWDVGPDTWHPEFAACRREGRWVVWPESDAGPDR